MTEVEKTRNGYSYQAYRLLQIVFVIAPILAGLDKFVYLLADWTKYLAPQLPQWVKLDARLIMMGIGVIEIIVGIGIAFKPKIFAYIVAIWLLLIVINLLILGRHYDVALRDLGLCLAGFALARLSHKYD